MQKIKNNSLLISSLLLTTILCFSVAFAKTQNEKQVNGAEHRSAIAIFVQELLNVAGKEQGEIGQQIRTIAQQQNQSVTTTIDVIEKVQTRSKIKTFLIGTNYKNIGQLRSETVKTSNQIDQLKRLLDKTTSEENKATLQGQVQILEQEQLKIENFLKINEAKFSLFGWFVKLFNK